MKLNYRSSILGYDADCSNKRIVGKHLPRSTSKTCLDTIGRSHTESHTHTQCFPLWIFSFTQFFNADLRSQHVQFHEIERISYSFRSFDFKKWLDEEYMFTTYKALLLEWFIENIIVLSLPETDIQRRKRHIVDRHIHFFSCENVLCQCEKIACRYTSTSVFC